MSDIAEAIQNSHPCKKSFLIKKLVEVIAGAAKKLEEEIKKYQEDPYVHVNGKKIKKTLNQCIPYTGEEWEKEMEKRKGYKNRQLINFIDKVFFEDRALQLEKRGIRK